jgi:predicted nucleotidyltransferase
MVAPIIIESVRNYLKKDQKEGIVIRFGVVLGSQVTGQADHWSDIDLFVHPIYTG